MTEATKASRAPSNKAAPRRNNAAAKATAGRTKPVPLSADQEADIRAGEAALRDAAHLEGAEKPGPRKSPARKTGVSRTGAGAGQTGKEAARRAPPAAPAETAARGTAENMSAGPGPTSALDLWLNATGDWREAGQRASAALAESPLTAVRRQAELGRKLMDFTLSQAAAQFGTWQAIMAAGDPASAVELQRKFLRQTTERCTAQLAELSTLLTDMMQGAAKSWGTPGDGGDRKRKAS